MKRTWMRSTAAVAVLAMALALAAPARAIDGQPWTPASDLVHAAWSWLTGLWQTTPREAKPPEDPAPVWRKIGSCIDPSGSPACQNQSSQSQSDAGGGADPDR